MPNDKHLPLCPFYKRHMERSITCEDVCRTFSTSAEKEMWLRTYCDTPAWEQCEYAQDLNKAYEKLFKGDDKAIMEQEYESLKREIKKLTTLLGKAEKRVERQQKKIDELRAVNKSFVTRNEDLYNKWRDMHTAMDIYEDKIADQVQRIADAYESRLAYMMDTFSGGTLNESDVQDWLQDKEWAIVSNDYGYEVVFSKEETDENTQEQEQVS